MLFFTACQSQNQQHLDSEKLIYNKPTMESQIKDEIQELETQDKGNIEPSEDTYYSYDAGFTGIDVKDIDHEYGNDTIANLTSQFARPHGFC
jgi:hypothetical protein